MTEYPQITIREGQNITVATDPTYDIQIGNPDGVVFDGQADASGNIVTKDIAQGFYTILFYDASGELVATQALKVCSMWQKESRKDYLRQQIELIDKVIQARLTDDEGVLNQLSINNKTLVYSGLGELVALGDSLRKQLKQVLSAENAMNGKPPFKQIKLDLRRHWTRG